MVRVSVRGQVYDYVNASDKQMSSNCHKKNYSQYFTVKKWYMQQKLFVIALLYIYYKIEFCWNIGSRRFKHQLRMRDLEIIFA